MSLRVDLALICQWIKPGSRVLDLGCGDGSLLQHLQSQHNVSGYGLEIDPDNCVKAINSGLNVIQTNLNDGLSGFDAHSFDYVLMTQTLQAVQQPVILLHDMLRVGREGIVTFPNVGYWKCRSQLFLTGRMPGTRALPNPWYNSPNIHLFTVKDFEHLCHQQGIEILQRAVVDSTHHPGLLMRLWPNWLGEIALYRIRKKSG